MRVFPASVCVAMVMFGALACPSHAGATYSLTTNPADVRGAALDFGTLPGGTFPMFNGTRLSENLEAALDYNFMGEPVAMGYRFEGESHARNTYFPGVATTLVFRFDDAVAAAGATIRGVPTAGINQAYGIHVSVYDTAGAEVFSQYVELPEPEGSKSLPLFVGVVSSETTIKEIAFSPDGIGGIACDDLKPDGVTSTPCPGDANGDRVVDFLDLNIVLSDFGLSGSGLQGDLDGDGDCDFIDLNLVLSAFGQSC